MRGADRDVAERPAGVRSIDRALSILEHLARADRACTLGELSTSAGLPSGTTHRLVRTLVARGYVRQLTTREYALGPSLVGLGDKARNGIGIGVDSRLQDLAQRAGVTAGLAILDGPDIVFVAQAAPRRHGVRITVELGERMPFGSDAISDAIRAALPPESETPSCRSAPDLRRRPRDRELAARLELVRHRGYAVDEGQANGGVRCLAVGLTHQAVPAAVALLGIGGSSAEFAPGTVAELRRSAAALSRDFGSRW